jgi:hypothetical protein
MPTAFPLAFNLADSVAEWPEIAMVVAVAFVGAYIVATVFDRMARWLVHNLLASVATRRHLQLQPKTFGQQFIWLRVLIFFGTWIILSLPMLDAIGLPLELGESRAAMRRWVISSGIRIAIILLVWVAERVSNHLRPRLRARTQDRPAEEVTWKATRFARRGLEERISLASFTAASSSGCLVARVEIFSGKTRVTSASARESSSSTPMASDISISRVG